MRTLVAIMIMVLMATSSAFARKASYHHSKRAAPKHQSATKANDRGVSNAIRTTSRSIEGSGVFAGDAKRPWKGCALRLGSSGR